MHKGPYDVLRDQKLLIQFQAPKARPASARLASQTTGKAAAAGRRLYRDIAASVRVEGMLPVRGSGAEPAAGRPAEKSNLPGLMSSNPFVFLHTHTTLTRPYTLLTTMSDLHHGLLLPGAKRTEESFGISSATLTHIYAYSIILQLTVCRNVNTHTEEEPLRFTTPPPPPFMPCRAFLP